MKTNHSAESNSCRHTPGPWKFDRKGRRIVDADGEYVAPATLSRYHDDRTDPEAIANARLIAAAPDLLAALRDLVNFTAQHNQGKYVMAARAAIAKAEGGAA